VKYLLILFVIAVALAPLAHFAPSKRQRKVAGLREYAAVHGLFVEFRNLPGGDRYRPSGPQQVIYYGRRLPPARGRGRGRQAWIYHEGNWRSLKQRVAAPSVLQELPAQVLAASVDEASCGIYWQESAEQEDVERIRGVLQTWADTLANQKPIES
jgi:hypothetical protein